MWGMLAGAAIGAGLNIFGSIKAASAAKKAGTMQAEEAERLAPRAREIVEQDVNPLIRGAYSTAQGDLSRVANLGADTIEQRGFEGRDAAVQAAREAGGYLDPYAQTGVSANQRLSQFAGLDPGFSADQFMMDPSYQWRLTEGQKALEKSAAARGGILGGGTLKALTRYAQGAASTEYGKAFDRLSTLADRGMTASTRQGDFLAQGTQFGASLAQGATTNAAGMRTNAAQQGGQWGIQSAAAQGGNIMDAEQERRQLQLDAVRARAAGMVGSANAWAQGASSAGNIIGQGLTLADMQRSGDLSGNVTMQSGGRSAPVAYGTGGAPYSPAGWGYTPAGPQYTATPPIFTPQPYAAAPYTPIGGYTPRS